MFDMVSALGCSKHSKTAVTDDALSVSRRASIVQAYSVIEHVARICDLRNWRRVPMAMLQSAFDVSYEEPKRRFLVMTGFVSEAGEWAEFDRLWRARLK